MQPVCVCVAPSTLLSSSSSGPSYLYRLHLSGKVGGSDYGPQDEGAPLMAARLPWLRVRRRAWRRIKALFVSEGFFGCSGCCRVHRHLLGCVFFFSAGAHSAACVRCQATLSGPVSPSTAVLTPSRLSLSLCVSCRAAVYGRCPENETGLRG